MTKHLMKRNEALKEENKDMASTIATMELIKQERDNIAAQLEEFMEGIASMERDKPKKSQVSMARENEGVNQLESAQKGESITLRMKDYANIKRNGEFFSFTVSIEEYKMCIEVYPDGQGDHEGTHISVLVKLLQDNEQSAWPFTGTIEFELLNQLADTNHHIKTLSLNIEEDDVTICCCNYLVRRCNYLDHS